MQKVWRKVGQAVRIGTDIKVTVIEVRRGRTRIRIDTPGNTEILWMDEGDSLDQTADIPLTTDVQPA